MKALLKTEWIKIKKTKVWLLLIISPIFAVIIGSSVPVPDEVGWEYLYSLSTTAHALVFLPLLVGILTAFVCRYEHQHNGWKQLFSMAVKRKQVFFAKYCIALGLLLLNQLILTIVYISLGFIKGVQGSIPYDSIFHCLVGGWVATLPLAALTLWAALVWSSFASALVFSVVLTLPNLLVINSKTFAPIYPWTQPFLMMFPQEGSIWGGIFASYQSLVFAIIGGGVVFLIGGMISIQRKAV